MQSYPIRVVGLTALVLLLLCSLPQAVAAPIVETTVYRGIMIDRRTGAGKTMELGTRSTLLRGAMRLYYATTKRTMPFSSYKGYTIYVPCGEHLSKQAMQRIQTTSPRGVVLELCDYDTANEETLAHYFSTGKLEVPVYFLPHGADSGRLLEALKVAEQEKSEVSLSVAKTLQLSQPTPNATLPSAVVEGTFTNRPKEAKRAIAGGSAVPTVLISAHLDSLGVAPAAMTVGGASGAVAAMELWRRLTAAAEVTEADTVATETQHPYSVTVLLGSTARFNYAGTSSWIAQNDDSELDRYQVVLSLDELLTPAADSEEAADLYLHLQDAFAKRPFGQRVVELATTTAAAQGIRLKVQVAKTNYQHYDLRFEHEIFSNRQMAAVTFSTHRTHHMDQVFRDRRQPIRREDVVELRRRVDFIEALVRSLTAAVSASEESPAPTTAVSSWPGSTSYMLGLLSDAKEARRSPVVQDGAALRQYATTLMEHLRLQGAAMRHSTGVAKVTVSSTRLRVPALTLYGPYEEKLVVSTGASLMTEVAVAAVSAVALLTFLVVEFGVDGVKSMLW